MDEAAEEKQKIDPRVAALIYELKDIKDQGLRLKTATLIAEAPEWFFHIGASKSGKYHPNYTKCDGGLLVHTLAVVKLIKACINLEYLGLDQSQKDAYIAACAVHDLCKYGTKDEPDQRMGRNHGFTASRYFEEDFPFVASLIRTHMGEWGPSKPSNIHQFMVHLADLLASRPNVYIEDADIKVEEETTLNDVKE